MMITLFKYRPFNSYLKPIIESQKIFFPARAKLNDLEDLKLELIEDVDAEVYRQFLLKKAEQELWPKKHLKYNLKKGFTAEGKLSKEAKKKIANSQASIQRYFDSVGILSLSEKEDDPVLWERYAEKEEGVCIVFEMKMSEYLIQVKYETPRPQPRLSRLLLSIDAEQDLREVLRTKTTTWKDEAEWRYFVNNGNTEFSFLGTIVAIRIGRKMSAANRQTITNWVETSGYKINIIE
jgi:hypothetical protein